MRSALKKEDGQRKKFKATFSRLGKKKNYKGYSEDTILMVNVVDVITNQMVADHVWFSYTKGFGEIKLTEGAVIAFEARVKQYTKGYVNTKLALNNKKSDFKLSHPTKISLHFD